MVNFDDAYMQGDDLFGENFPFVFSYLEENENKGTLLDMGCGYGRDAIAFAKMGYDVTGVDISMVGVNRMMTTADEEGVSVQGFISDMLSFEYPQAYDMILMDMVIQFLDTEAEQVEALMKAVEHLNPEGQIVVVAPLNQHFMDVLDVKRDFLNQLFQKAGLEVELDEYYLMPEHEEVTLNMVVAKKEA